MSSREGCAKAASQGSVRGLFIACRTGSLAVMYRGKLVKDLCIMATVSRNCVSMISMNRGVSALSLTGRD